MTTVIQRPLRGSRISTFYPVKNLPSLASLDSAFQLQEYISLLIRLDVHDVNSIISLPGSSVGKDKEKEVAVGVGVVEGGVSSGSGSVEKRSEKDVDVVNDKGKGESTTVDEACWIYEQLRRLAQDLSHPLITTLQQECTRASCPEMKAGEWLYLCVAHGNDGAMEHCCAIDYILHTVDSATALLNSPRTFPSRLQIPVASHRHFSSLARRLGRIFAHAYFHHREAFEQAEAESSLYARFLALTERFELVPAEFLVIPTDNSSVGNVGDSLGLGPPPPRTTQDDHRRLDEFDRSYHQQQQQQQQQQQRTRYDLDLVNFHEPEPSSVQQLHSSLLERDPSPPGPFSSESSSSSIGESPSHSARVRFGRHRTGTMVFAEAEANAVTDELAARSSIREREREPQKIELLERDGDPLALATAISAYGDEEMRFEINPSLEEDVGESGEGGSNVAPGVFIGSPLPEEKHELPSLLDLDLESEAAGNTAEMNVLPSAPAEPEVNVSAEASSHSSTVSSKPVEKEEVTPISTSDIVADQPKEEPEEPVVSATPTTSTEIKSEDDTETQPIPTETTTDIQPIQDTNVSIPEPTLISKETTETEIVTTEPDSVADDKETIAISVINDDESPTTVPAVPVAAGTIAVEEEPTLVEPEVERKPEPEPEEPTKIEPTNEGSLDEVPAEKTQAEVVADVAKPVVESSPDMGHETTEDKREEKSSIAGEEGEVKIEENPA